MNQSDDNSAGQSGEHGAVVTLPPRVSRFASRIARLQPGKYLLTLTITEERAYWTIQEMNRVEA
jgi:hypothetical protein